MEDFEIIQKQQTNSINQQEHQSNELTQLKKEQELQKQIEEYQTLYLLNTKKLKAAEKKKALYQEELSKLEDYNYYNQISSDCKQKKKELKEIEKQEQDISNKLLPYLKFKISSTDIKPTDFYDMIVNCNSILELLDYGWRIQFNKRYFDKKNPNSDKLQNLIDKFNKPSYQLGIIGDANKGKSFFLSQVCKKKFEEQNILTPTGMTVSTQGLSVIKFEFEKDRWLDVLDSEGFHAPIQYELKKIQIRLNEIEKLDQELQALDKKIKELPAEKQKQLLDSLNDPEEEKQFSQEEINLGQQLKKLNENQLNMEYKKEEDNLKRQRKFNDRQVSEKLIQQYILKTSSMILVLVGDLTINEQKRIEQIINSQQSKPIIIVHNMFKLQTFKELQEKIEVNINQSFQVKEQTYINGLKYYQGMQKIDNIVKFREIFHIPFGFQADDQLLKAIQEKSITEYQEYIKISEINKQSIQFVMDKINFYYANLSQLEKRSLIQSLQEHFTQNITDYIDLAADSTNSQKKKFQQLTFNLAKQDDNEQLLKSNELIELNYLKAISLKYFNFDSNNQLIVEPGQQIINPKYSLMIKKDKNNKKNMIIWIEMPPISQNDIPNLLKCTKITKDNDFYYLRLQNFRRTRENLCKLFKIDQNIELKLSPYQAVDTSRLYKIEGVIELDIKLCLIRDMKIDMQLNERNVKVTDGGLVWFDIDCEDLLVEINQNECWEDPGEVYL